MVIVYWEYMNKLFIIIISMLLVTSSCTTSPKDAETNEIQPVKDFMKITTLILNPELEGTGYWVTDRELAGYGQGYWVSDDGKEIPVEQVFIEDELEVGVPRTLAPLNFDKIGVNWGGRLKIHFEFDGILEIDTEDPESNIIRLAYWQDPNSQKFRDMVEDNTIRTNAPVTIDVCPVGKELVSEGLELLGITDTIMYKEYILYARAYKQSGEFVASAEIKLTVLPDEHYPYQEVHQGDYSELYRSGEERSRFLSIELVSYEYSDTYKLMGEYD